MATVTSSMSTTWAGVNISCSANKMNIAVRKSVPTPRRRLKSCRSKARRCALKLQRQLLPKACYVAPRNFGLLSMMYVLKIRSQNSAFLPQLRVERLLYPARSYLKTMAPLKSSPTFLALLIRVLALLSWDLTALAKQLSLRFLLTNLNQIPAESNMATV